MNAEAVARFALSLPGAAEDHPFGPTPDVFRVAGRIFAFVMPAPARPRISLKCDPGLAELLRERHPAIAPRYHLNKRHWNTIELDGTVPADEIEEMVLHSYGRVVAKLPKAVGARLFAEADRATIV